MFQPEDLYGKRNLIRLWVISFVLFYILFHFLGCTSNSEVTSSLLDHGDPPEEVALITYCSVKKECDVILSRMEFTDYSCSLQSEQKFVVTKKLTTLEIVYDCRRKHQ